MCVLFHTLFNAAYSVFVTTTTSWVGTVVANTVIVFVSILTVVIYNKKQTNSMSKSMVRGWYEKNRMASMPYL